MISTDAVACKCNGDDVYVVGYRPLRFFGFVVWDSAPKQSNIVTTENQKNRRGVKSGKVTSWGEHGRVAILTNPQGLTAAFYHTELSKNT